MKPETILITGCSSGIGKVTARWLAERGHRVIATAPSQQLLSDCPENATLRLVLDVTDDETVRTAVDRVEREVGPISVLINNAGFCQPGPIEQLGDAQIARQFEVNVFGALRTVRAVLPGMRNNKRGRVINVSSVVGVVSFPFIGLYSASKHALEALSDALRIEVAPFGVEVVVIEPGWIRTDFARTATELADRSLMADGQPYAEALRRAESRQEYMRYADGTPEQVAAAIVRAVEARSPETRYRITAVSKWFPVLKTLTPTRAFDSLHRLLVGL
jgi:NAD(P)-dependent dehydrogenase (short-subunit alcohol dehydrogenase family)